MRTLFSKLGDYELVDKSQDLRGLRVVDGRTGRERGVVRDLVVDTAHERVTAVLLEDGAEIPLAPLTRRDGSLVDEGGGAATRTADVSTIGETRNVAQGTGVVVPVAEEHVSVAKRTVPREAVRVESRVVEEPRVEEVTLREEHVHVERRAADRPASPGDVVPDRTVEVGATREVPVVEKQARVVEEVVVGKHEEQRRETVRETARRTDVRISPTNARPSRGGPPASR